MVRLPKTSFYVETGFSHVGNRDSDEHSLKALFDQCTPLMLRRARSLGFDHHSAKDVVQTTWETFLHAPKSVQRSNLDVIQRWLVMATGRAAADFLRRQRWVLPLPPEDDTETWEGLPETEVLRLDRAAEVGRAFRRLSPRCRQLLQVLIVDGSLTYGEIADQLHLSPGTVGPYRSRCLRHLRQLMADAKDLELSPREAVVRVHTAVEFGKTAEVDFSYIAPTRDRWVDGTVEDPAAEPTPLRVVLYAEDAVVHPMTRIIQLTAERTCRPVPFQVVPVGPGPVELVFRIYLRDGQLLQEIRAGLPVGAA